MYSLWGLILKELKREDDADEMFRKAFEMDFGENKGGKSVEIEGYPLKPYNQCLFSFFTTLPII